MECHAVAGREHLRVPASDTPPRVFEEDNYENKVSLRIQPLYIFLVEYLTRTAPFDSLLSFPFSPGDWEIPNFLVLSPTIFFFFFSF